MFGMPAGSVLAQVVHELTQPHARTHEGTAGQQPALLDLLRVAIRSDVGGAAGGGGTRSTVPFDPTALQLWGDITAEVYRNWRFHYPSPLGPDPTPLVQLQQWCSVVAAGEEFPQADLWQLCTGWKQAIMDMLEPPTKVALRGVTCPACKFSHLEREAADGEKTYIAALVLHASADPVRAECLVCGEDWINGELLDLSAGKLRRKEPQA